MLSVKCGRFCGIINSKNVSNITCCICNINMLAYCHDKSQAKNLGKRGKNGSKKDYCNGLDNRNFDDELWEVIDKLANDIPLEEKYKDHWLNGKKVPTREPMPSPRRVLVRPGSSSRFTTMMEERFLWSARCSAKTTKATGA